jgi:hypothetical protein
MRRQRFAILNLALLLLLALAPAMEGGRAPSKILFAGIFVLVLVSAVYAVGQRWHARRIVLPLAALATVSQILDLFLDHRLLALLTAAFGGASLLCVILLLARRLFTVASADYETINASLCVYLLMGVLWSIAYSGTELLAPGSFAYPLADGRAAVMEIGGKHTVIPLYYSFVTMTTLGYGDIVPLGSAAKVLAIGQAVLGQVYLVVIVARLVGLQVSAAPADRG